MTFQGEYAESLKEHIEAFFADMRTIGKTCAANSYSDVTVLATTHIGRKRANDGPSPMQDSQACVHVASPEYVG